MPRTLMAAAVVASVLVSSLRPPARAASPSPERSVDQIVAALRRPSVQELWLAHRRLTELGRDAVPAIKAHLARARPAQRLALARALSALGHAADAIEPLIGLVRAKGGGPYAVLAAQILGESPTNELQATEDQLLRLVGDRSLPPEVQRAVARSLGLMASTIPSSRQAIGTLRRLLLSATDPEARRECALALGELDHFQAPVEAILMELRDEPTARGRLARALLQNNTFRTLLVNSRTREQGSLNNQLLSEVKALIQRFHVEPPLSDAELVNAAAKGMARALNRGDHPDRHSAYFDEKDWQRFREQLSGHYGGIGAAVQFTTHFDTGEVPVFTVARPNYHGPAYEAGLRSYDRIVEIDGVSTALGKDEKSAEQIQKSLKAIVKKLRGKPGTTVEVAVTRPGSKERRKVTIERAEITLPTVRAKLLPGQIGYVRLSSFGQRSAEELEAALADLERRGMRALIFDLRNNPGGQLSVAVEVADKFLKDNRLIVYTQGRNPQVARREEFRTKDPTTHPDYPIVVLVNGHSASASEIVAGAFQDHRRALVLGTVTYGKGSVQKIFALHATGRRSVLKLTIAKYYLPSGRSIHGKGIEPDLVVEHDSKFTHEEFETLRKSGALYRYSASRFHQHKALLATLADFDALDPGRYPDFDLWYKGLAGEVGRDKARRVLRAWLRVLVADDRGEEFVCDLEEDNQLQAAILELAKRFGDLDPRLIPQYRFFASQRTRAAPPREAAAAGEERK